LISILVNAFMAVNFADAVASWPPANYGDPPTRGNGIIIVTGLFGGLGTIATALRIYTRLYITRTFGADDVFIIFALVCLSKFDRAF
jgi:hypothetical protein